MKLGMYGCEDVPAAPIANPHVPCSFAACAAAFAHKKALHSPSGIPASFYASISLLVFSMAQELEEKIDG